MRTLYLVNSVLILSFFTLVPVAQGVLLKWNNGNEPDLAGYNVYLGTSSGDYSEMVDAGNVAEYKLRNLKEVENYYIAVTAYDVSGNESDFSEEIEFLVDDGVSPVEDNCSLVVNGPLLGTCAEVLGVIVKGTGVLCSSDEHCGTGQTCQLNQEDYNANGIGDACECYGDLDGDGNVYPNDISAIIREYGREDCMTGPPCQADLDGDGNVYPRDLSILLIEYGRTDCQL